MRSSALRLSLALRLALVLALAGAGALVATHGAPPEEADRAAPASETGPLVTAAKDLILKGAAGTDAIQADAVMVSDRQAAVVWREGKRPTSGRLKVAFVDVVSNKVLFEGYIFSGDDEKRFFPRIASDGTGRLCVTWLESVRRDPNGDVAVVKAKKISYDDFAVAYGTELLVSSESFGADDGGRAPLDVTVDNTSRATIIWTDGRQARVRHFDLATNVLIENQPVSVASALFLSVPRVVSLSDGTAFATFTTFDGAKYTATGVTCPVLPPPLVSCRPAFAVGPVGQSLAWDGGLVQGGPLAAFEEIVPAPQPGPTVRPFDPLGNPLGPAVRALTLPPFNPFALAGPAGTTFPSMLLAPEGQSLRVRYLNALGVVQGGPTTLMTGLTLDPNEDLDVLFAASLAGGVAGSTCDLPKSGAAEPAHGIRLRAFTFHGVTPCVVTVKAPNGGETFTRGKSLTVRWQTSGTCPGAVRLELWRGTLRARTIAASTANDGSQTWTLPTVLATGNTFRAVVKLPSAYAYDRSNANFTIK